MNIRRKELQECALRMVDERSRDDELWADMRSGLCSFCQRPVTINDFVEFATLRNGRLFYPEHDSRGGEPVAYLTHTDCSPINGYWLALDRLDTKDLEREHGLLQHIESKVWSCWQYSYGLRLACNLAEQLAKHTTKPRSTDGGGGGTRRVAPSPSLRARVFERDGFLCRRCGHGPPSVKLVLDHVVPVAIGGATTLDNLQSLCQTCNAGKSARPPHPHDLVVTIVEGTA